VLLVVSMLTILIGTLYPLFLDALGLPKLSVGPPYFSAVFVPLMLPLVFLMGLGPLAKWRRVTLKVLFNQLKAYFLLAFALGVILPVAIYGDTTVMTTIGIAAALWAVFTAGHAIIRLVAKRDQSTSLFKSISKIPRAMYGMSVAHIGLGVFVLGVVFTSSFSDQKEMAVKIGDSVQLAGYSFLLDRVASIKGSNYQAVRAYVDVSKDDQLLTELTPEKRIYNVQRNPMTEASIDAGLFRDLYVALGEPVSDQEWGVRIYYRPFIQWIWIGTILMALGGILGATDKRYRLNMK